MRSDIDMFSGREVDVMNALWELGSATVSEVQENLSDPLAYTTVQTLLSRLEEKGRVRHEVDGKAHRYFACVHLEEAQDNALQRVTRKLFAGSPPLVMARLLTNGGFTEEQLRELRNLLDRRLRERGEE